MKVPSLDPGCPWYDLSQWALPNVKWCEAPRCSWVVEPANSWSNLAYLVVAFVLWREVRVWSRSGQDTSWLTLFPPAAFAVGLTSFVYHASYTFVFQIADFIGMFVFIGLPLALNLHRLWKWNIRRVWLAIVCSGTLLVVLLYLAGLPIQVIVALLILAVVASEIALRRRSSRPELPSGSFLLALALLSVAGVFSLLDVTRLWCQPTHPFLQGHAIWHLLSATSMVPLFYYYRGLRL